MINTIVQNHMERMPAITSAVLRTGRRRAVDQSQQLNRAGAMKAAAIRCNAAVVRLIELAYTVDADTGSLANVDDDGVFDQFPVPWSTHNYGWYGLQRTEADVLARHVHALKGEGAEFVPLWTYDELSRQWAVNLFDYPTSTAAIAYWDRCQLTAAGYKTMLQEVRNRRSKP